MTLKKTYIYPQGNWVIVFQWSHRDIFHHGIIVNRITQSQCLNHRLSNWKEWSPEVHNEEERTTIRRSTLPLHCNAGMGLGGGIFECKPCGELVRWSNTFRYKGHSSITHIHSYKGIIDFLDWNHWLNFDQLKNGPNSLSSLDKPTRWSTLNNSFFRLIYRCGVWIPTPPWIDLHGLVMLRQSLIQSIQHVPKLGVVFKTKRQNNRQLVMQTVRISELLLSTNDTILHPSENSYCYIILCICLWLCSVWAL